MSLQTDGIGKTKTIQNSNRELMNFFDRFLNIISNFEKEGVEYVLIGGYAIVLHGFARLTQDIDVFLNATHDNVERLKKSLRNIYDDNAIDEISLSELEAYPVIRYGTEDGFYIDIIIRIGTRFQFDDIDFQVKEIEGVKIKVATPETLYALKKDSYREIDRLDIRFLETLLKKNAGI